MGSALLGLVICYGLFSAPMLWAHLSDQLR